MTEARPVCSQAELLLHSPRYVGRCRERRGQGPLASQSNARDRSVSDRGGSAGACASQLVTPMSGCLARRSHRADARHRALLLKRRVKARRRRCWLHPLPYRAQLIPADRTRDAPDLTPATRGRPGSCSTIRVPLPHVGRLHPSGRCSSSSLSRSPILPAHIFPTSRAIILKLLAAVG